MLENLNITLTPEENNIIYAWRNMTSNQKATILCILNSYGHQLPNEEIIEAAKVLKEEVAQAIARYAFKEDEDLNEQYALLLPHLDRIGNKGLRKIYSLCRVLAVADRYWKDTESKEWYEQYAAEHEVGINYRKFLDELFIRLNTNGKKRMLHNINYVADFQGNWETKTDYKQYRMV